MEAEKGANQAGVAAGVVVKVAVEVAAGVVVKVAVEVAAEEATTATTM